MAADRAKEYLITAIDGFVSLEGLFDTIRLGTPCLLTVGFIVMVFFFEAIARRRKGLSRYTMTKVERQQTAFLRWTFISAITFVLHSVLLSNPASFDYTSSLTTGIPHFESGFGG